MLEQILKHFWVVTIVFLTAAAILAAQLTSDLIAQHLWVAEVDSDPIETRDAEPVIRERLADYRVIQERNLFNANPKPPPEKTPVRPEPAPVNPEPVAPPVVRTPLNLTLFGTAVIEGGRSYAVVEVDREVSVVREGNELAEGAVLTEVLSDRIRVERGGNVEEFLLYPAETDRSAVARSRRRVPTRPRTPDPATESDTIRQVEEDKWLIDAREVEEATSNMSRLMTQLRVVPNFSDGQPDGFKVFAIRPGSLFAKIGLKNGDVVKRINGLEIQGPEQAFEAYQRLKDESSIQIDLTRNNQNQSFTYEIR